MSAEKTFTVTWSERIQAQATVVACCEEHAKQKAEDSLHTAVFNRMADYADGEILEFEGADWEFVEADDVEDVS